MTTNQTDISVTFLKEPTEEQRLKAETFKKEYEAENVGSKVYIGTPIPPRRP
jgi:hypothetical protein